MLMLTFEVEVMVVCNSINFPFQLRSFPVKRPSTSVTRCQAIVAKSRIREVGECCERQERLRTSRVHVKNAFPFLSFLCGHDAHDSASK